MTLDLIKKITLVILCIIIYVIPISATDSQASVNFRTYIDINTDPFFSESTYNMMGLSLSSTIMAGAQFNNFGFGVDVNDDYFILNGRNLQNQMNGYWNVLRGSAYFNHQIFNNYLLQWGSGVACIQGDFNYNLGELFKRDELGWSLLLNLIYIFPWDFMEIKFLNRFDLYLKETRQYPYYSGSLRLNLHPFLDFISIYLQATGTFWQYEKEGKGINTSLVLINLGFSIKLDFPDTFVTHTNNQVRDSEQILKENQQKFELLLKAKKNTVIDFDDIRFYKNTINLKETSLPLILKIAEILKSDESLVIAIKAYADYLGDPEDELDLIIQRGRVIKNKLIESGIDDKRVKILASGNVAIMKDPVIDIQDYSGVNVTIVYRDTD